MTPDEVKVAPRLGLRPNPYFDQVGIPFLYQKRAILLMFMRERMVLGDDVGLGKSLESIVAFSYMKMKRPGLKAIIFSEKSALLQWKKELQWLTPGLRVSLVTADSHPAPADRIAALRSSRADVKITSYYTIYQYLEDIMAGLGDEYVVFCDECSYFKNSGTKMFTQMQILCSGAARAYGMTATVVENRLDEAYCILRIICPGLIPSRQYFERNFLLTRKIRVDRPDKSKRLTRTVAVGYKNVHRFRELIEPGFYGRLQTDPEVEQDLPEDIHKDVPIMMSVEQSKKYLEAQSGLFRTVDGRVEQMQVLASLTLCQQMCNSPLLKGFNIKGAKEDALIEQLTGSLLGEKVLIFSKYRSQVDRLETLIREAGLACGRITGSETGDEREAFRVKFQTPGPGGLNILLITRAGQKALNLQLARHIIMFDLPWSYGMYRQIIGRAKRTGSSHSHIGVYRYLAELHPDVAMAGSQGRTIDHHVLGVLMSKKDLFNALLDDDTSIVTTDKDLAAVLDSVMQGAKNAV